jgi:hypothetical protein
MGDGRSEAPRPFVLSIDVEPPDRQLALAADGDWTGFEETVDLLETLRARLARRTRWPPRFAWFLRADPQIGHVYGSIDWVLRRYGNRLRRLASGGDSMGLHVHAFRWSGDRWVSDHADRSWVAHCIAAGWLAFRRSWGDDPQAFRFGDRWLSNDAVRQLETLGCAVDVTVEAGMPGVPRIAVAETATGELPDYRAVPRYPFRPSRDDFRVPAIRRPRKLWLLPVTTGCINAKPVIPATVEKAHDMVHLNLALDPGWIRGILDAALETEAVVVSVLRTGDVASPGALTSLQANVEHLANHRSIERRELVDPLTAVQRLLAAGGSPRAVQAS